MTYLSRLPLYEGMIGLVILCRVDNTVTLDGRTHKDATLKHLADFDAESVLRALAENHAEAQRVFGLHAKIPHRGEIIGAGFVMMRKGTIYYVCHSASCPAMNSDDFEKCFSSSSKFKMLTVAQPV